MENNDEKAYIPYDMVNIRNTHKMFATIIGSFVVMTLNVSEIFIKKKKSKINLSSLLTQESI